MEQFFARHAMSDVSGTAKKILGNVEKVIIGKRQEIVLAIMSYFCQGHILLEDVPGMNTAIMYVMKLHNNISQLFWNISTDRAASGVFANSSREMFHIYFTS